jgi:hypothetical protein
MLEGSVPFSAFWPRSSMLHELKPAEALKLVQLTLDPQAAGMLPVRALRLSRMVVVVSRSRSCTGSVPVSPSPFSTRALRPATSPELGLRVLLGVALPAELPKAASVLGPV